MSAKRAVAKGKTVAKKIIYPPYMKITLPAGQATAAPPLGPQLGQVVASLFIGIKEKYIEKQNEALIIR